MHVCGRFSEGVTDIRAQSIQVVGIPKEVFADYKLSHVPTMYVYIHVVQESRPRIPTF